MYIYIHGATFTVYPTLLFSFKKGEGEILQKKTGKLVRFLCPTRELAMTTELEIWSLKYSATFLFKVVNVSIVFFCYFF